MGRPLEPYQKRGIPARVIAGNLQAALQVRVHGAIRVQSIAQDHHGCTWIGALARSLHRSLQHLENVANLGASAGGEPVQRRARILVQILGSDGGCGVGVINSASSTRTAGTNR